MSNQEEEQSYQGIVVFVEKTYGDEQQVGIYTRTGVIKADVPRACSVGKVVNYDSNGIISTVRYPVEYKDPGSAQLDTTEIQGSLVVKYKLLVSGVLEDEPRFYSHPILNQVLVPKTSCFTRGHEISIIAAYVGDIVDYANYHMVAIGWVDANGGWIPFNWEKGFDSKEMSSRVKEIYHEYKQKVNPGRYEFLKSNNIEKVRNRFSTFDQRQVQAPPVNDPDQPGTSKDSEKWEKLPEESKIVIGQAFDMGWINKQEQPVQPKPERVREATPKQASNSADDEDETYLNNILNQASSTRAAETEAKPKYSDEHLQIKSEIARKVHAQLIKDADDPKYIMPRTTYILEFIAKTEGLPQSFDNQPGASKTSSQKESTTKAPKTGRGEPKFLHEDVELSEPMFEGGKNKSSMPRYGKSDQGFETGSTSKPEAFYPKQREYVNNEDNDAFDFDLSSQQNSTSSYIVQEPATPTESSMIGHENSQWKEQRSQSGSAYPHYENSYQQSKSRPSENYGYAPSNRQTLYTNAQSTRQGSSNYQQPQKQYRSEPKDQNVSAENWRFKTQPSPPNKQYGFFNANRQSNSHQNMYDDGAYGGQQQTHFHEQSQQNWEQSSSNRDHFRGNVQEQPRQQTECSFNRFNRGASGNMTEKQHNFFWNNFKEMQKLHDLPDAFKFACDEFEQVCGFNPLSDESFCAPPSNMTPDQERFFWDKFNEMQEVHYAGLAGAMEFTCKKFASIFGGRQLAIEAPPRQQSVRAIQAPRDFENRGYQGEQRSMQYDDRRHSSEHGRQRRSNNYQFEQQSRQSQRDYQSQPNYNSPQQRGNFNDQYEQQQFYNNQGSHNAQNRQYADYSDPSRQQHRSAFQNYQQLQPRFFRDPNPNRKPVLPSVEDLEDGPVYQTGRRLPKGSRQQPPFERVGPDSFIEMTENMCQTTENQRVKVLETEILEQEHANSVDQYEFMPISARRQRNPPVQYPSTSLETQNAPRKNKVFTNQNFANSSDDSSEDEEENRKQMSSRHSRQGGVARLQRRDSVSSEDEPQKVAQKNPVRQTVPIKPNVSVPQPSKPVQPQASQSMTKIRKNINMYESESDAESDECSDEDDLAKILGRKK